MFRWILAALVAVFAVGSGNAALPAASGRPWASVSAEAALTWKGKVVAVADGDTLEVLRGGKAVRVRLAAVDAPEWGQPWSRRAKARLSELVFRRFVTVVVRDVDRYGRDVVDVILSDGRRVNELLVAEGLAWFYAAYSNDAGLAALEAEARAARRGLWSQRNPTPPWVWRQRHSRKVA